MASQSIPVLRPAVTRAGGKRPDRSLESYAHKAAKAVVMGWFRDAAATVGFDGCAICLDIPWRVNRDAPTYGIWEEYPILDDGTGAYPVWDETCLEDPEAGNWASQFSLAPPTFAHLSAQRTPPRVILDVAIQHKGSVIAGVEIVHKNPPTDIKIAFLRSVDIHTLLVLPTRWILGQVGLPASVPPKFWALGRGLA